MTAEQVIARIRRAILLDATAYEETRDDNAFTVVSLAAAGLAVLLGAIGAWLWASTVLEDMPSGWFVDTVILGTIFLLILWLIGVGVMYLILAQLYGEQITPDGLLRVATLGHLPFALSLLVFIPEIGFGFAMLGIAATFFYTNFAIQRGLSSDRHTAGDARGCRRVRGVAVHPTDPDEQRRRVRTRPVRLRVVGGRRGERQHCLERAGRNPPSNAGPN